MAPALDPLFIELESRSARVVPGYRFAEAILKVQAPIFTVGYDRQSEPFLERDGITDALVFNAPELFD